ncbi:MAG: AAA family ATPase [Geobacteraceae bacterium]
MPPHISIVIIDSDNDSRDAYGSYLKPFGDIVMVNGSVADFSEGMKIIQSANPMVVILEVKELGRGVEEIKHILSRFPHVSIFVAASEKSSDWILTLMRAGAVEYLLKPVTAEGLAESLHKVGRLRVARPDKEPEKGGKIIAVYNPVGGMGTTTIAVNLAATLAADDAKVALVDLNLFSGDVSSFLDINPTYNLSSVTSNIARLDASFMMSVMSRHSSGVYVLTEPLEVEEVTDITPDQIRRVLQFLKKTFSFQVIDTSGQMEGINLAIFESADYILFNTVLSLPALKNAKRYLAAMEKRGIHKDRLKLVVNRYLPKSDIKVEDAEGVLGRKVYISIPNEYSEVIASINKGIPVVKLYPRSTVSKSFTRLAEMLKT